MCDAVEVPSVGREIPKGKFRQGGKVDLYGPGMNHHVEASA